MNRRVAALVALILLSSASAHAAEPRTEHTYQLAPDETRPAASLEDASWLVGSWTGTGFGQRFEQVWNAPTADSMVGLFKLYGDDGVAFYEILLLVVEDGTLSLKVKHFNPDFTAWEDKSDYVNFRLVKKEADALHFGGLSFYKCGNRAMDGYILMRSGEDFVENHLRYQRAH